MKPLHNSYEELHNSQVNLENKNPLCVETFTVKIIIF